MASVQNVQILGVPVSRMGFDEALTDVRQHIDQGRGGTAYFVNVHTVTESGSNPSLRSAIASSTWPFADGKPLVWVSRWKGEPIHSRVCGPDFTAAFLEANGDITHAFVGGRESQGAEIAKRFGLKRSVVHAPPMRPFSPDNAQEDWRAVLAKNGGQAPQAVWIGLGAPKQELWAREISKLAPATVFFAVGAAFDFLSGTKSRAPVWMQNSGLEWLFRLASEPRRLAKRYLVTNTLFCLRVLPEIFLKTPRQIP